MSVGTHELDAGALLAGRYRIVAPLGRGGMGAVYEAVQEGLGRRVAVKVLRTDLAQDAQSVARFRREAETIGGLGHPNIVQIVDFHEGPGAPFIVMELVPGESLSALLKRERVLSAERACRICSQLLSALDAAHAAGVVHRDLKPANVMLVDAPGVTDFVKLLDFGVAKLVEPMPTTQLTESGMVVGTVAYMAPEQLRAEQVSPRADLYAVGVILYQALTGRLPFGPATQGEMALAILHAPAPPLTGVRPDLPPSIAAVVARALEKDPAARFSNAASMRAAIEPWARASPSAEARLAVPVTRSDLQSEASAARLGADTAREGRSKPRWLAWAALGAIGVVALLAVGAAAASMFATRQDARNDARRRSAAVTVSPHIAATPSAVDAGPAAFVVTKPDAGALASVTPPTAGAEAERSGNRSAPPHGRTIDAGATVALGDVSASIAELHAFGSYDEPAIRPAFQSVGRALEECLRRNGYQPAEARTFVVCEVDVSARGGVANIRCSSGRSPTVHSCALNALESLRLGPTATERDSRIEISYRLAASSSR